MGRRPALQCLSACFMAVLMSQKVIGLQTHADTRIIENVHRAVLDLRGDYVMLWVPEENIIRIEIQVKTLGWAGLGFSPRGGMKGADIVLGWVDHVGKVQLHDRFAYSSENPSIDESQDYTLLGGYQNDTHTVLKFSRPWMTCDRKHDLQLSANTVRVIWSYSDKDPEDADSISIHISKGVRSLYLMEPNVNWAASDKDSFQHWDVLSPNVLLPEGLQTLYWCKLYKMPDLQRKNHMVGYTPLLAQNSLQLVHHMLLYECHLPHGTQHLEKWVVTQGSQCYSANMPVSWNACGTPIVAWAMGSEGEMYPDHVGIPLGTEHDGATYFMLEIHYDNPSKTEGLVDNSGIRIYYTENLRENDAGILTIGHMVSPSHIIPPGRRWTTVGHCTSECTGKTLPKEGIHVFSSIMHAHLLGASVSVTQIRRSHEMSKVIEDDHYDFNYQQSRTLKEEMIVLPGDFLITHCGYDSTDKHIPTFGGFATTDEMCLVFLAYYPRVNLSVCYSRPDMALLFDTFGIQNLYDNDKAMLMFSDEVFSELYIDPEEEEDLLKAMLNGTTLEQSKPLHLANAFKWVIAKAPEKYENKSFYEMLYDPSTWEDSQLSSTLQEMVSSGTHDPSCLNHGRMPAVQHLTKVRYPDFIPVNTTRSECTMGKPFLESNTRDNTNITVSLSKSKLSLQKPLKSNIKYTLEVTVNKVKEESDARNSAGSKGFVPVINLQENNAHKLHATYVITFCFMSLRL